jgi:hypothetical protein
MKKIALMICITFIFAVLFAACASDYKKGEQELKQPINCATAEGDIRSLQHEKAHVADQVALGVTSIVPVGLVAGVATGTEGTKVKVATGDYNKMIDKKIAEIKQKCGVN